MWSPLTRVTGVDSRLVRSPSHSPASVLLFGNHGPVFLGAACGPDTSALASG